MDTVTNPRDPRLLAVAGLESAAARARDGRYLVEGPRLVRQALAAGVLRAAWLLDDLDDDALAGELAAAGIDCLAAPARLGPRLIGTSYRTRLGAVGVVERRVLPALPTAGLLLLAESIADPRNVGVLVRTAEAAGAAAFGLSDDSADPWARGAVRSSTGSLLRQPLYLAADLPAELARLRAAGVRVIASSARATQAAWAADLRGSLALLVGSEATGLSPAALAAADEVVALPTAGGASSLNVTVAAGALLYEAQRQRLAAGAGGIGAGAAPS